jgi:hypothetical protein
MPPKLPWFNRVPVEEVQPQLIIEVEQLPEQPYIPQAAPEGLPAYAARNYDYFLSQQGRVDERAEFIRRGLVPTNNLRQYFDDSQPLELTPGHPWPLNRHNQPFGPIIDELRAEQPELWERAASIYQTTSQLSKQYRDLLWGGKRDEADQVAAAFDDQVWLDREIFSEIFLIIAPRMEAKGIDPLSACI